MLETSILGIDHHLSEAQYGQLLQLCPAEKREKIAELRRFEDRERSLLGDVLARTMIGRAANMAPSLIACAYPKQGKPHPLNMPGMHFNISHAGAYVACSLSDRTVGVDIEEIRGAKLNIAERFFCPAEVQYIKAQPADRQATAFCEIWTKKEAYMKYKGEGLGLALDAFDVCQDMPGIYFQRVFENADCICHVCTEYSQPSQTAYLDVSDFIRTFSDCPGA